MPTRLYCRFVLILVTAALGAGMTTAGAQAPSRLAETYDDWTVTCIRAPDKAQMDCELSQYQVLSGQEQPSSEITVVAEGDERLKAIIQVQSNLRIAEGVTLVADEKSRVKAAVIWCVPSRCVAETSLDAKFLRILQAGGDAAQLVFKDAAQRDVAIPVSLKGFDFALAAMRGRQKEAAPAAAKRGGSGR